MTDHPPQGPERVKLRVAGDAFWLDRDVTSANLSWTEPVEYVREDKATRSLAVELAEALKDCEEMVTFSGYNFGGEVAQSRLRRHRAALSKAKQAGLLGPA